MPKRSVQVVTSKSLLPHLLPLQYSGCTNLLGAAAALFPNLISHPTENAAHRLNG